MTGLNHDFLLLSVREYAYGDYMKLINHRKAIHIHDDVMHYLADTLNWVMCYNPARNMMKPLTRFARKLRIRFVLCGALRFSTSSALNNRLPQSTPRDAEHRRED
jgi:hypothetical protein